MNPRDASSLERESRANQEIIRILEASKALSETIYDELSVLLVMVDDHQRILKINRMGQLILEVDESQILGESLQDFLPPEAASNVVAYFAQARGKWPKPSSFETEYRIGEERKFFHWQLSQVHRGGSSNLGVHILIGNDTTKARVAFEKIVDLRHDLEVGGTVQNLLLPKAGAVVSTNYDLSVHYEPSAQVGGDIWWCRSIKGAGSILVVCDVMGHGVGAAIASATLIGALESQFRDDSDLSPDSISRQIAELDLILSRRFAESMMFCTAILWLPEGDTPVYYWNFGLPIAIHTDKDGRRYEHRIVTSDPMGIGFSALPTANEIELKKDDRLFLFSDGCYEFEYAGRDFGRFKFSKTLKELVKFNPQDACAAFASLHRDLRGSVHPKDDVTLAVIKRKD